jgi:hypothetical protein
LIARQSGKAPISVEEVESNLVQKRPVSQSNFQKQKQSATRFTNQRELKSLLSLREYQMSLSTNSNFPKIDRNNIINNTEYNQSSRKTLEKNLDIDSIPAGESDESGIAYGINEHTISQAKINKINRFFKKREGIEEMRSKKKIRSLHSDTKYKYNDSAYQDKQSQSTQFKTNVSSNVKTHFPPT